MVDERGYPVLDLSPLTVPGQDFAVRCSSREEALHFISTMLHQHREVCGTWVWPNTCWDEYNDLDHIDYYPDINDTDGGWMSYDTSGWAEEHSEVIVIPFCDIYTNSIGLDLGELPDADIDILGLFDV